MLNDLLDPALRLLAATAVGAAIGLNRDLRGKPTGVRTLGLVALGSALITVATMDALARFAPFDQYPDAASRVMQGLIQGILTGIGFIGAGVILHDQSSSRVQGLTTAASVWVTAIIGVVCGLGEWTVLAIAMALTLVILTLGGPFERSVHRLFKGTSADADESDASADDQAR